MIAFRKIVPLAAAVTALLVSLVYQTDAAAPGPKVSAAGNKHNLSGQNTGVNYKATNDPTNNPRGQQICIFCHTPHNANVAGQAPLWNRAFSSQTFQRYTSTTLHIRHIGSAQYGVGAQPNGSSKLCLSCHDGVSKMGDLFAGPAIPMSGSDVIAGLSSFNPTTNKMLTGHHPVSFVYLTGFNSAAQSGTIIAGLPASYRFIPLSSAGKAKLFDTKKNSNGWMQCTTCHDPHQNQSDEAICYNGGVPVSCNVTYTRRVAPFWTYHGTNTTPTQDTGSVCKVCHSLGTDAGHAPW